MRREDLTAGEGTVSAIASTYHDRSRTPAETVALMRPHFAELGITRVARQTGLDRVGIPCFAAFRPNSCSIACNQGKGVDDDLARASAVMEAVEYAIAERPTVPHVHCSAAELAVAGHACVSPRKALPLGEPFDADRPISWLEGRALSDGRALLAPLELVALSGVKHDFPSICQHTNGLASGNNAAEATFHGVCELIERDGNTLWSLLSREEKLVRCLRVESFGDDLVIELVERFESAGLTIRLFDQTTDLGIPTMLAVSAPADGVMVKHFDVAAGSGTHLNPARAALRAITEAAQTRVTSIAAARDDIRPDTYRLEGSHEARELIAATPVADAQQVDVPISSNADKLLSQVLAALRQQGVDDLVAVPLGGDGYGISVVHVLSEMLEDRGPNANWRPGPRGLAALLD